MSKLGDSWDTHSHRDPPPAPMPMLLRCQMAQDKPSLGETAWWPLPLTPILSHTLKTHGNRNGVCVCVGGRGGWISVMHQSMRAHTEASHWLRYKIMACLNIFRRSGLWLCCLTHCAALLPFLPAVPCNCTSRCYLTSARIGTRWPGPDLCCNAGTTMWIPNTDTGDKNIEKECGSN